MSSDGQIPSYPGSAEPPRGGTPAPGPRPAVEVPPQVNIAFWLYLVAALISLVSLIVSLATTADARGEIRIQLAKQGHSISQADLNALVAASIGVAVVLGVLFIAAYVLFAFFARRGANWARIVLLIVTVLSLLSVGSAYGFGAARVVVGAIATVLIFLRPASDYFRAVKAAKAAARR